MSIGDDLRAMAAATLMALAGCGGGSEAPAAFDVAAGYARVSAARARLEAARDRLARAETSLAGAAPADSAAEARDAQNAYDEAYASDQRTLAAFLNRALNEAPGRPETRLALDQFAADAAANARLAVARGADLRRPGEALARAERAYGALGLRVPTDLGAAARELRAAAALPRPSTPVPTRAPRRPGRRP